MCCLCCSPTGQSFMKLPHTLDETAHNFISVLPSLICLTNHIVNLPHQSYLDMHPSSGIIHVSPTAVGWLSCHQPYFCQSFSFQSKDANHCHGVLILVWPAAFLHNLPLLCRAHLFGSKRPVTCGFGTRFGKNKCQPSADKAGSYWR